MAPPLHTRRRQIHADTENEALDSLVCRFLANLPPDEYAAPERFFFHLEEAFWFYTDFHNPLPPLTFPEFCRLLGRTFPDMFPFLAQPRILDRHLKAFLSYKKKIPVNGIVCLHKTEPRVLLCQIQKHEENKHSDSQLCSTLPWCTLSFDKQTKRKKHATNHSYKSKKNDVCRVSSTRISVNNKSQWTFPQGKIRHGETFLDCALREFEEETGIPSSCLELNKIEFTASVKQTPIRLFVAFSDAMPGTPSCRGEILQAQWAPLDWLFSQAELPHHPFLTRKTAAFVRLLRASMPFSSRLSELCVQQWRDYVTSQLPDGDAVDETRHAKSSTNVGDGITHAISSMPDKPTCAVSSVCVANEKRLPFTYTTPPTQPNNKTKDGDNTKDTNQDAMVDTTRNHTREENPLLDFRFDVDAIMALVDPTKW